MLQVLILFLRASFCISKLNVSIHASLVFVASIVVEEKACSRCDVVHERRNDVDWWRNCELPGQYICTVTIGCCGRIETTVESLGHSNRLTVDVQYRAIGSEFPPFQGFL